MPPKKDGPALYELLKTQLLDYINTARPRLLPGENEIAAEYGMSRTTVRRALRDLTDANIIRPVQGLGTLVNDPGDSGAQRFILLLVDRNWGLFAEEIFRRLLWLLREHKLHAILSMIEPPFDEPQLDFLFSQAEGVILDPWLSNSRELHDMLERKKMKSVSLRWISPFDQASFVTEDVPMGYDLLTRHLLELGHREIAVVCHTSDGLHLPGIRRAFQAFGLEFDERKIIHLDYGDRSEGYRAADRLLAEKRRFTAVIAHNDAAALGIMERLLQAGLRVPEDVSLVGSDNVTDSVNYPVPLTTICSDHDAMIHEAIRILLRNDSAAVRMTFPMKLIVRGSTAPPPRRS